MQCVLPSVYMHCGMTCDCVHTLAMLCSPKVWQDGETYVLLFLAVVNAYHVLLLLFGTSHCCSIMLGECCHCLQRLLWAATARLA